MRHVAPEVEGAIEIEDHAARAFGDRAAREVAEVEQLAVEHHAVHEAHAARAGARFPGEGFEDRAPRLRGARARLRDALAIPS